MLWAKDGKQILYLQDSDGNANNHLYSVDIDTKTVQDLTPYKGVRAQNIVVNKNYPEEILIELNQRNPQFFDVYRINLLTKKIKLDTQNPGDVEDWLADANMQIRSAVANNDKDGSSVLRTRLNSHSPWHNLITWPFGESGSAITFNKQGDKLTLISTLGSNTARLVEIDANTGKVLRILAQNSQSDVSNVMTNDDANQLEAVQFDYLRPEWQVIDPAIKADFATLTAVNKGVFLVTSHDINNQLWIVGYYSDTNPGSIYLYNRTTKKLQLLFNTRPALQKYTLAAMQPIIIPARDGTPLVSYLTLPVGTATKNLPMVLVVHGGPWDTRDDWGYSPITQLLANRGYAVLQVDFRGTPGLGKQFLNAGNGQWGTLMQQDLTDAVQWAINQGIANPKKIGIFGGSYGGYAALAGLTFTPQLYACGVDLEK